ncbi:MAG: ABC transporter ATP-binding protein [Pseudomonadota bacterium]
MLELSGVQSGYGETQVLHGVDLTARAGRVLAVLGRNGAGKSTTLKTIMGLLPLRAGWIAFQGTDLGGMAPHRIATCGIAYVPETRDVFPSLTVRENLEITASRFGPAGTGWTIERVLALFPKLAARLGQGGGQLSGGEQQMLTIARALLMNPRLLILDEPTEGLAPIIVEQIHATLAGLRQDGLAMVVVEQNVGFATSLADDVAIIGRGTVVWSGTPDAIRADADTQRRWLGV